jgi:hypothetical protein
VNFLRLLLAGRKELRLTEDAFAYMERQRLCAAVRRALAEHPARTFADEGAWQARLGALGIGVERHARIATEGPLAGQRLQDGHWRVLAIVSDDAGQFAVPLPVHGLCWVHAERSIHKLNPGGPAQQAAVERARGEIWAFYAAVPGHLPEPQENLPQVGPLLLAIPA